MNTGTNLTRADSGILSEPFAFPHSGAYNWNSTSLGNRSSYGNYWTSHAYSTTRSHYQAFGSTIFGPQNGNNKGYGVAVRCTISNYRRTMTQRIASPAPL